MLILVLLLLHGGAAGASATDCADANELYKSGELVAARARYEADANKNLPCAVTALAQFAARRADATKHFELAKIAEKRKRTAEARTEYLDAIKADPTFLEPIDRLQQLVKPSAKVIDPFQQVRTLLAANELTRARNAVAEIVKSDPTVTIPPEIERQLQPYAAAQTFADAGDDASALEHAKKSAEATPLKAWPDNLLYLNGGSLVRWRSIKLWFERTGKPMLQIAATAALAGMIIFVFVWTMDARGRTTLQIADFTEVPTGLSITTAPPSSDLTALVRETLGRMTRGLPSISVSIVSEPITLPELPVTLVGAAPASIASWVNAVISFLRLISPVNELQVTGQFHHAGKRGTGLTLVLTRNRRVEATTTIWQRDFDPGSFRKDGARETSSGASAAAPTVDRSAIYALAEPAAVWLLFQIAQSEQHA